MGSTNIYSIHPYTELYQKKIFDHIIECNNMN